MVRFFTQILIGVILLLTGVALGIWFGPQLTSSPSAMSITSMASQIPILGSIAKPDANSPFELYEYPTIKFRPKPLNDAEGALAQLSTRFEKGDGPNSLGKMNYKLTIFKAPGRQQCEIQLLDDMGFKLSQFSASDFQPIPGSTEVMESRDAFSLTEAEYKKVRDYSVK